MIITADILDRAMMQDVVDERKSFPSRQMQANLPTNGAKISLPYAGTHLSKHKIPPSKISNRIPFDTTNMGIAFDYAPDRPEHIETILNGLDRYNPETTTIFQDYVAQQCEDRTYDCYANLALLKLYVCDGFY